jgi:AcrR family transcriptional regulator
MPKLWTDTVEEHRRAVRDAVLAATAKLVAEQGLTSVTMSGIAAETGVGRATLYKYFPDVEAILTAWHERQVTSHLQHLAAVRDQARADDADQLEAVLTAYALMIHEQPHGSEIAALLHRGEHVDRAHQHLAGLVEDLVAETARRGGIRHDVVPAELASYCLHALAAAARLRSRAAVHRLVAVTLAGLHPPPPHADGGTADDPS